MKIIGINIENGILSINIDTKLPEIVQEDLYLYIDTLDNYSNRNSAIPSDHSYSVLLMNEEGDQVELTEGRSIIYLDIDSFDPKMVLSAFTVTIEDSVAFYYDTEELYYKQIDLLCNHCSTCLDDQQKDRIMLFMLKYNLLQYAVEHDIIDDQVQYYKDIARMLNINTNHSVFNDGHYDCSKCCKSGNKTFCTSCCNCKNGVCSLC